MSAGLRHTTHPFLLTAEEIVGPGHFGPLGVLALLSLLQIVGIIALVAVDGMVVELIDARADILEKIAVVRDHEQRDGGGREIFLQPFYHSEVEVIGRLVENKQFWFAEQDIGQSHTLALAAGELAHAGGEVGYLEPREHLLDAIFVVPDGCGVDGVALVAHGSVVAAVFGLYVASDERGVLAPVLKAGLHDGLLRIVERCLAQVAHPEAAAVDNRAAVVALLAAEDAEHGRFSASVAADEPDLLPLGHREGRILHDGQVADGLRERIYVKNCID